MVEDFQIRLVIESVDDAYLNTSRAVIRPQDHNDIKNVAFYCIIDFKDSAALGRWINIGLLTML